MALACSCQFCKVCLMDWGHAQTQARARAGQSRPDRLVLQCPYHKHRWYHSSTFEETSAIPDTGAADTGATDDVSAHAVVSKNVGVPLDPVPVVRQRAPLPSFVPRAKALRKPPNRKSGNRPNLVAQRALNAKTTSLDTLLCVKNARLSALKDTFGITIARDANLSKQGMARAMHVYGVCPSRHRCRELLRMVASDCDKEIMACKTPSKRSDWLHMLIKLRRTSYATRTWMKIR